MVKKVIENREFNALEIIKMYDDDSILCDVIIENEGVEGVESVEVKREKGIGFVKEVWQEMLTLTDEEIKQLKGISEEAVLWAE